MTYSVNYSKKSFVGKFLVSDNIYFYICVSLSSQKLKSFS